MCIRTRPDEHEKNKSIYLVFGNSSRLYVRNDLKYRSRGERERERMNLYRIFVNPMDNGGSCGGVGVMNDLKCFLNSLSIFFCCFC